MRLIEITFGPEKNFTTFKVAWVPGSVGWFYRLSKYTRGWFWFVRAWRLDLSVKRGFNERSA